MSQTDGAFEYLLRRQGQIDHGVVVGSSDGGESVQLSEPDRAVHTYVCGVSGSGKSRFLQNLLFQDISKGHPVCLIDPMGDLYRAALEFIASRLERARDLGFGADELMKQYLFLDGSDDRNPLRVNPLEPQPREGGETSEQQVDDLMRALERLMEGDLEGQRRLRNVLRAAFMMLSELNRLPAEDRPSLAEIPDEEYPLGVEHSAVLLSMQDHDRQVLLRALPKTARLQFHEQYWEFLALNTQRERLQLVQSSWNVLQYLLADDLVLRVLGTRRSTFHPAEVLRQGRSLFCFLPKNENLAGARFLGKFLTTKLQHAAYRRPEAEWQRPLYLYLDEFHQFVDQSFADAMTNLRKFGLRVTNAHQSRSQPPFDSTEGQALLRTITANSRVKVLFRLDRPDAEDMSRELFALTQRRQNFTAVDYTVGENEQRGTSASRSTARSSGTGRRSGTSNALGDSSLRSSTGESRHTEHSTGEQTSDSEMRGSTRSATAREVHYTLEGERELFVNELQGLPDRHCLLSTAPLKTRLIETPYVPDSYYAYVADDLPSALLEGQRQRHDLSVPLAPPAWRRPLLLPAGSPVDGDSRLPEADAVSVTQVIQPEPEGPLSDVVLVPAPKDDDDPFLD